MSHLLLHTGMGGVAFTMCVGDQSTRQSMVANAGHSPVSSMALKHDQPPRTSFTRHGGIAVPLRTPYRGLLATELKYLTITNAL